jgi:hypothetical protein
MRRVGALETPWREGFRAAPMPRLRRRPRVAILACGVAWLLSGCAHREGSTRLDRRAAPAAESNAVNLSRWRPMRTAGFSRLLPKGCLLLAG